MQIKTDQHFWHGLQRVVQGRQNSGGSGKTFLYRFAMDSPTQNHYRIRRLGGNVRGVCHADDVCYLFKNIFGDVPARDSVEFQTITRFVSCIDTASLIISQIIISRSHSSRHLQRQASRTITLSALTCKMFKCLQLIRLSLLSKVSTLPSRCRSTSYPSVKDLSLGIVYTRKQTLSCFDVSR